MGPVAVAGGAVNPGDPVSNVSSLSVSSANFANAGTYTAEVAGNLPSVPVTADVLNVATNLTLGGTSSLTVDLAGLLSGTGGPVTIITAGSISGQFPVGNVTLINNPNNLQFTVGYTATTVTLNLVGAATQFGITTTPTQPIAGVPFTFTVSALDQFGGVASSFNGTHTLAFTTSDLGQNGFIPTLPSGGSFTFVNGVVHFWLRRHTLVTAGTMPKRSPPPTAASTMPYRQRRHSGQGIFTVLPNSRQPHGVRPAADQHRRRQRHRPGQQAPVTVELEDLYGNVETLDNASSLSMAVASTAEPNRVCRRSSTLTTTRQ